MCLANEITFGDFLNYCAGKVDGKPLHPHTVSGAAKVLKRLLCEAIRRQPNAIVQVGRDKFYVKDGWQVLASEFLVAMRGYSLIVKPAMGNVLWQLNTAMSAFYKPMTVRQFFRLFEAAGKANEAKLLLNGVKVYINYSRSGGDGSKKYHDEPARRVRSIVNFGF